MSYIYVITNDINGKQYVGKTNRTIELRFKEHISDKDKRKTEKRPLYDAMNKYGIEHFSIRLLEECDEKVVQDREIYWINKLNTYKNGYNATLGGDGKILFDYDKLASAYLKIGTIKETAEKYNCSIDTVRLACRTKGIEIVPGSELSRKNYSKKVQMLPENIIFSSLTEAANYLQKEGYSTAKNLKGITVHIRKACKEKTKSYKHIFGILLNNTVEL